MSADKNEITRRSLLNRAIATGAGLLSLPILARETTPRQPKGPYYPRLHQRKAMYGNDSNNDLTKVAKLKDLADGTKLYLFGRLTDQHGDPIPDTRVEVWQACHQGRYRHPGDEEWENGAHDPKFQYWGVCKTDKDGNYAFKTIIPPNYPAGVALLPNWERPPHIHFRIVKTGYYPIVTQIYFDDKVLPAEENQRRHLRFQEKDAILRVTSEKSRKLLQVELTHANSDMDGRLSLNGLKFEQDPLMQKWGAARQGRFDIVMTNLMKR